VDPLSQGIVGAVAAGSIARKTGDIRLAAFAGLAGGMLADTDVLIRSENDSLLTIQYHRHFTHSLLFIPVGGAICAALLWCLFLGRRPFRKLYLYATAGYATSGLLDACTSYGTHLFWPFTEARTAWNIISIVDPIFTGTLVVLVAIGIWKKRSRLFRAAAGFALCYLAFGVIQNQRAARVQEQLAKERGHAESMEMATVKPSIGNLVLWRSVYRHDGQFFVDAIRVGFFQSNRIFEGTSVKAIELSELQRELPPDSVVSRDLERFDRFSAGYLARHPAEPGVIADLRYSLLPNSVKPLWGIRYDPAKPEEHAAFESFRVANEGDRRRLFGMIFSN